MENLPNPGFVSERAGAARSLALRSFEAETGPFGSKPRVVLLGSSGVGRKRVMSRGLFLLAALPLVAAGYFVRDGDLIARAHLYTEAFVLGSGGTDVVRPVTPERAVPHAALPSAAHRLFHTGGKEPRADLLDASPRTQTVEKRPHMMVAAITPYSDSASLPEGPANTARINRTGKQSRLDIETASQETASQTLLSHAGAEAAEAQDGIGSGDPFAGVERASAAIFMMAPTAGPAYVDGEEATEEDAIAWPGRLHLASLKTGDDDSLFGGFTEAEFRAREMRCMAAAIYFEARSENRRGQIAVAQVVMNRVRASAYPDTICGVIYQGQWNRNACQFSFACDGKPERPDNKVVWEGSMQLAKEVMRGEHWLGDLGYATHYHATYVKPHWARHFDRIARIGRHIFYKAPKIRVRVADTFDIE